KRTDEVPPPPPSEPGVGRLVALAPLLTTHRAGAPFPGAPRVPHFETPHLPDLEEQRADAGARWGGWAETWKRDTVPTRPEGLAGRATAPSRFAKLEHTALLVTVVGASAFALG